MEWSPPRLRWLVLCLMSGWRAVRQSSSSNDRMTDRTAGGSGACCGVGGASVGAAVTTVRAGRVSSTEARLSLPSVHEDSTAGSYVLVDTVECPLLRFTLSLVTLPHCLLPETKRGSSYSAMVVFVGNAEPSSSHALSTVCLT